MTPKRTPKSKEQVAKSMKVSSETLHLIATAKKIYPLLEKNKTIYDAQTASNAAAGFIKLEIEKNTELLRVADLMEGIKASLKAEKKSVIKDSIENIINMLEGDSADTAVKLLERMGAGFTNFGAHEYLKNPMSAVKMKDFIK